MAARALSPKSTVIRRSIQQLFVILGMLAFAFIIGTWIYGILNPPRYVGSIYHFADTDVDVTNEAALAKQMCADGYADWCPGGKKATFTPDRQDHWIPVMRPMSKVECETSKGAAMDRFGYDVLYGCIREGASAPDTDPRFIR